MLLNPRHRFGQLLTALGFLLIAGMTLYPLPEQAAASRSTSLWCLVCGKYGGVDVLDNILLFVPFAAGLALLGMQLRWVVLTGFLLSLAIESLQYLVIPGRDASLSDLVTNTLGSWAGALLSTSRRWLLSPRPRTAGRLAAGAALTWLGVQGISGALLRPWSPPGELRGVWARQIPGKTRFEGRVTSAFLSGTAIPGDSTEVDTAVREHILRGRIHLELSLETGRESAGWSPVMELLGHSDPVLTVETNGRDAVVQMPARAHAWKLRSPSLRIRRVLPRTHGAVLHLAAGERRDTLWAAAQSDETGSRVQQVLSPSLGWSLVVPFHYAYGDEVPWLTGLWIAGWMVPIAYWAAATGEVRRRWGGLLLLLLVGLGFVPHLMGYPPVPWWEWMAGAAGLALGWAGFRSAT